MTDKKERKYTLTSRLDQAKAFRYVGSSAARVELPMLHPDHIKHAAGILIELATDLEIIAKNRMTNVSKILEARIAVHIANGLLRDFARGEPHDMMWEERRKHFRI